MSRLLHHQGKADPNVDKRVDDLGIGRAEKAIK